MDQEGLHGKYVISRADGKPIPADADFYVLQGDSDPLALDAMMRYADHCRVINPKLAVDLWNKVVMLSSRVKAKVSYTSDYRTWKRRERVERGHIEICPICGEKGARLEDHLGRGGAACIIHTSKTFSVGNVTIPTSLCTFPDPRN